MLYLPLPQLKTATQKADSIQIGTNSRSLLAGDTDSDDAVRGGKWEDEEERRFYEDIPDLKDYIPRGVLGIEEDEDSGSEETKEAREQREKERVEAEVRKLEEELADLEVDNEGHVVSRNGVQENGIEDEGETDEDGYAHICSMINRWLRLIPGWQPQRQGLLSPLRPARRN